MSATLYARLLDAKAHLGAARVQRAPLDDAIIAEHIEAAERIVGEALREIETGDPVIDWPRPSCDRKDTGLRYGDGLKLGRPPTLVEDDGPDAVARVRALSDKGWAK